MDANGLIWSDKVSNVAQVGGIETSILDNGLGKGVRIAWFNTGSGLRFKVVIDRAMDIADAFYNQYSLAWLNHAGTTYPQPFSDKDVDWLRTFGGGLVITCGLSHVGGPEKDAFGERGLHGLISNIPAEIESIIQPDPSRGKFDMSITGIMKESKIFGPSLELRRTISATLGKSTIRIHDEIINRGNTKAPHMLLYHCNFGWPMADEGSQLLWKGPMFKKDAKGNLYPYTPAPEFTVCPPVLEAHSGTGEEVAIIDIAPNPEGTCVCGINNPKLGLAVTLKFSKNQLPWLTNWHHYAKGEYVTGIEPGTHPPIGQSKTREEKTLLFIEPGESKTYDLEIDILNDPSSINQLIQESTITK
jgi:hypothetical protein